MKKVLLFILSAFAVFMLSGCDDSSSKSKPYIPIAEAPSSKALTPNNVATVTSDYDFPILWRVDGKADDVLVFVKDGKVLGKLSEYYVSSQNTTPVINYHEDSTAGQENKLIIETRVSNMQYDAAYDLMGSKIVKVGSGVEVTNNAAENTLTGAEDVISFAELIQGFAVYEEGFDDDGEKYRYFNFDGKLFNDINATVTVSAPVVYDTIPIQNLTSLRISAIVPAADTVIENAAEQGGMKYAMYAGRVIEYPRFNGNKVTTERLNVKFNLNSYNANYGAYYYDEQGNYKTLNVEIYDLTSGTIDMNITGIDAVPDWALVRISLGEDSSSSLPHWIRIARYYLEK